MEALDYCRTTRASLWEKAEGAGDWKGSVSDTERWRAR